jgi:hypothetical protein
MLKRKVTLGNYWVEAFCCCFFGVRVLKPHFLLLKGIFSLDCCDSVWKTGWSVSIFMRNSWDSSFGIPILYPFQFIFEPASNLKTLFLSVLCPLCWGGRGALIRLQHPF